MAGFRALAAQVRDPGREASQRRQALRKCLERFAPYGHRATWHHLCANAGFAPDERSPDSRRLVAALEELEEARSLWLSYEREFAKRRKLQKHFGIRQPTAPDIWHRKTWGGRALVRVEEPTLAPRARLSVVLRRLIAAMEASERSVQASPPREPALTG